MVTLNDFGLIKDFYDNIAILNPGSGLIFQGSGLKELLLRHNYNLQLLNFRDSADNNQFKNLADAFQSIRKTSQPESVKLPGLNEDLLLIPASDENYFFGLKDKISRVLKIEYNLKGRVKELECLYNISKESNRVKKTDDFLLSCTKLLQSSFQYPAETSVTIRLGNKTYGTIEFSPDEITETFSSQILKGSVLKGEIKIFMTKGLHFLKEEEKLVDEIANKISRIIEMKEETASLEKQQNILTAKNEALLKMTEECYQKREKLKTFFRAITDKIIVIDHEFNIIMSNKDEIDESGKCYTKLFNLDQRCEECPAADTFSSSHDALVRRNYQDRNYTLRTHPILGIDGKVERVLEVCRDITDQKNMEEKLFQSYKLASLGKLVAGVAHEINNPNTFILGNLKIVQEAFDDIFPLLDKFYAINHELKIARLSYELFKENINVLVKDMINGANRTKRIVSDLRNFAKKDEGGLTDILDLNDIIKNNLTLTRKHIKKYALLETDLNENIPTFTGNINKLEQVLLNLIMNASEAIENGEGIINLKTDYDERSKEVLLIISDNGSGMDDATVKNIFDPFFTTKRDKGGIGLGLSISYGIIKDHKGKIDVTSKPGAGTIFTIRIPVKKTQAKQGN